MDAALCASSKHRPGGFFGSGRLRPFMKLGAKNFLNSSKRVLGGNRCAFTRFRKACGPPQKRAVRSAAPLHRRASCAIHRREPQSATRVARWRRAHSCRPRAFFCRRSFPSLRARIAQEEGRAGACNADHPFLAGCRTIQALKHQGCSRPLCIWTTSKVSCGSQRTIRAALARNSQTDSLA